MFQHLFAAGHDVSQQVLAVAVDGDDAPDLRKLFQHIGEGGFQRPALALVDPVVQHMALGVLLRLVEPMAVLIVAAVIHNHNVLKAVLHKPIHNALEFAVRVQGGENNGKRLLTAFSFCHMIILP